MMDPLSGSPFGLLDARGSLRLLTDTFPDDDVLTLALVCRPFRDVLSDRFIRLRHPGRLLSRMRNEAGNPLSFTRPAVAAAVARIAWTREVCAECGCLKDMIPMLEASRTDELRVVDVQAFTSWAVGLSHGVQYRRTISHIKLAPDKRGSLDECYGQSLVSKTLESLRTKWFDKEMNDYDRVSVTR